MLIQFQNIVQTKHTQNIMLLMVLFVNIMAIAPLNMYDL